MKPLGPVVQDLLVFSRVVGTALLVAGYLLAGYWIGRSLLAKGYPSWTQSTSILAGAAAALFSGYREIRELAKKLRR